VAIGSNMPLLDHNKNRCTLVTFTNQPHVCIY